MGALDISIVGPALPSIEETIKIDQRLIGWIFSIYVLFNLMGISLFAKLSDLYGRRRIYIISVLIFALGSLWVSLAHSFEMILVGRAIQGFGSSGIFPVASATVGDVFPPEKRGRVLGLIGMVFGVAFIIGPILAGSLLSFFSWNSLFIINIPISLLVILAAIKYLPNERIVSEKKIDWLGIALLASLLSSFAFGLNQIDEKNIYISITNPMVYGFMTLSILLFPWFIYTEKRAISPILKVNMFYNRQIRLVGLIAFGTGLIQASFVFFPAYAVNAFAVAVSTASFMLVPIVLATAIGSPIFGRMLDHYGSRLIILIGIFLMVMGFLLISIYIDSKIIFYIAGLFIGLGLSVLSGSSLRYIMLNEVNAADRALTQGMVTIFTSVGQLTGGAFIGMLLVNANHLEAFSRLFLILAITNIIMFILSFRLKSRRVEQETYVKK
jgi:EmrB/QacA subfamily drug resistance transporter